MPDSPDLSALQLLLPGAEALLAAVRDLPGVGLLAPPHVSLGYPWVPAAEALSRLPELDRAAASVPAFRALLTGPHSYPPDSRGRTLVHARFEDEWPVRALAAAVGAQVGSVHLSLARVTSAGSVEAVLAALSPLLPAGVAVDTLELTVRVDGTWSSALRARLGVRP